MPLTNPLAHRRDRLNRLRSRSYDTATSTTGGPHGKTVELIEFSRRMRYRQVTPALVTVRDRSLRGKARRRARKTSNRLTTS